MKDKSVIIAETPRVVIRYFCTEDFADLAPILANLEVMKYSLAGVLSSDRTRKFLKKMLCRYKSEGYGYYAISDRENKQLIGYCGLLFCLMEGEQKVEIGYRLDPHYWQKGLATEAAIVVKDYAFNQLSLNDLIALIQPKNIASIKVAEKIGMKFERNYIFIGMPVKIYRMFKP
jgi:RimJ/RimL family protein N-acetyltransferase